MHLGEFSKAKADHLRTNRKRAKNKGVPQAPFFRLYQGKGMIMLRSTRCKILARDQYECQACGVRVGLADRDCEVHHLEYGEDPDDITRLITLCRTCHTCYHGSRLMLEIIKDPRTGKEATRLGLIKRAIKERIDQINDKN